MSRSIEVVWGEAVELARDLVAAVDVQPHNKFWQINNKPRRIEELLNEVGLYDHLFGMRQFALSLTPLLLRTFFGKTYDSRLTAQLGWNVRDAELLSLALVDQIRADPQRLTRDDLMSTGLSHGTLDRMLRRFAHKKGTVNAGYVSPLSGAEADLMFRPLVEGEDGNYYSPAAATVGPACYEVVATAVRETLSGNEVSRLVGEGTERSVGAIFREVGMNPTIEGGKYNEGKRIDAGECDLVLEDNHNILFVECKGKPVTRATMAGVRFAAVLDYVAGIVASQVQALQHERLLRDNGEILFDNGQRILLGGREITRLGVTLFEQGSFQDHFLFVNLVEPLLRSDIDFDPGDQNRKKYEDLRKQLEKHRNEMTGGKERNTSPWQKALSASCLSFGQLAVILCETRSVSALVDLLREPVTYGTMNPLLEYSLLREIQNTDLPS